MNKDTNIKIKSLLDKNEVCLFMKGTPEIPQCGFSLAVSNVLKHLNVKFNGVNILEDLEIREGIKEYSDWPTIPQLYIHSENIGPATERFLTFSPCPERQKLNCYYLHTFCLIQKAYPTMQKPLGLGDGRTD